MIEKVDFEVFESDLNRILKLRNKINEIISCLNNDAVIDESVDYKCMGNEWYESPTGRRCADCNGLLKFH